MSLTSISPFDLLLRPYHLFDHQSLVLTSGSFSQNRYNAMVIGWGSMCVMWNKPILVAPVRPTRYTFEFMEEYPDFTVCAFPTSYRDSVQYLGTHSGRHEDKIAATNLTPISARVVQSPVFAEAELVIECRTIYREDLNPTNFLAADIANNYAQYDYHRLYYGQILSLRGSNDFIARHNAA